MCACVVHLLFAAMVYRSEWWEVLLSGDRCLYPESFHLFASEVCVGELHSSVPRRHGALCLPLASEELYRLPPTDDATLVRFNILDAVLQLQLLAPLLLVAVDLSARPSERDGPGNGWATLLHIISAVLMTTAVAAVLSAPTASAEAWASGLLTCDVAVRPGVALGLAILSIPVEGLFALSNLRASVSPVLSPGQANR